MLGKVLNSSSTTQEATKKSVSSKNIDEKDSFKALLQKNLSSKNLDKSSFDDPKNEQKIEKKSLDHSEFKSANTQSNIQSVQHSEQKLSKNVDEKDPKILKEISEKDSFKALLQKNLDKSSFDDPKNEQKIEKKSLDHSEFKSANTQSNIQSVQHSEQKVSKFPTTSNTQPIQAEQKENILDYELRSKETLINKTKTPDTNPLKNILAQTKAPSEKPSNQANATQKKLSDITTLAEQKNLHLQEAKTKITQTQTDSPAKNTQNIQTIQNKPLSLLLNTVESKHREQELKERENFNKTHKIKYKFEGKTERIAIIERGKTLPKNIVGQRLRQEERTNLEALTQKDHSNLKKDTKNTNTALAENIPGVFTKDIKFKNALKNTVNDEGSRIEITQKEDKNSKVSSQKKNKKSNMIDLQKTDEKKTKIESQATLETNKNTFQENQVENQNQEILDFQKTKKTHSDKQIQKDTAKESVKENALVSKEVSSALGVMPKIDLSYKIATAKATIKNFTQNLNEELKKYKPPMSKISLELHPEKLGKLELTIKQSGNNLHISVVSNSQAIALFIQNQAELRQNLATIGFGDANLNFSSKNDSQDTQQDSRKEKRNKNSLKGYEDMKNITSAPYDSMEIILPRYV